MEFASKSQFDDYGDAPYDNIIEHLLNVPGDELDALCADLAKGFEAADSSMVVHEPGPNGQTITPATASFNQATNTLTKPEEASFQSALMQVTDQLSGEVFLARTSISKIYVPYYEQRAAASQRKPLQQLPITPNAQGSPIRVNAISPTTNGNCEAFTTTESAPRMSFATGYISSSNMQGHSSQIFGQLDLNQQAYMLPTPTEAFQQQEIAQSNYVVIPTNYALQSAETSRDYPVQEIYETNQPELTATKEPKKRYEKIKLKYGTRIFCNICDREFGKIGSYRSHCVQKHDVDRSFQCNRCGKKFLTEEKRRAHVRKHDLVSKPWKCNAEGCAKSYMYKKDLDRHITRHKGEEIYLCRFKGCQKRFARRDHKLAHEQRHENRMERQMRNEQR